MRPSKKKVSKKQIETEIYKNFQTYKKQNQVTIAEYLKTFNTKLFQNKEYRKIRYNYESLIKLVLFQQLKGIKFHTKLTKYLRRNPKDKYRLGFSKTPDRTSIGYFINHILDPETKEVLKFTSKRILEVSEKYGILLDVKTLEPKKPKKETLTRNKNLQKHKHSKEVCRLFKKRFTPFINFHMGKNTVYSKKTFIDLLIHMCQTQDFAENGSNVFKQQRIQTPDADTLLYHLKKYENIKEIQDMFQRLFEIIWDMTKQANLFDTRKKVDLAIDYTEWFYYGNRKTPMVVAKMPERGTDSCYKFITINIVDSGKRFTLLALPVSGLSEKEKLLTRLLLFAKRRVRINHVYLDRGFFDSKSIKVLNGFGVRWLMPGHKNFAVRRAMELSPTPCVITDFRMKNTMFNLVIDKGKITEKIVFATNMNFGEDEIGLMDRLCALYSKRWGIETSYRVKKHSFRAKTTSKNYHIRLFYFLFSVLLYNLWILADLLIWLHVYGFVGEDHKITSKLFGSLLMNIDLGG